MSTTTAKQFEQLRQRVDLRRKFDKWLKRNPFPLGDELNAAKDAWVQEARSTSLKLGLSELDSTAMIQMAKGTDYITLTRRWNVDYQLSRGVVGYPDPPSVVRVNESIYCFQNPNPQSHL